MKKLLILLLSSMLVVSCKVDKEKQLEKEIDNLEDSGKIPKYDDLDRSESIAGDVGKNGVRKDVEKLIKEKYPNQIKEAMQFARSMQAVITVDVNDEILLNKASRSMIYGISCVYDKYEELNLDEDPDEMTDYIESITVNTRKRIEEYLKFNHAMNGSVTTFPRKGEACEK